MNHRMLALGSEMTFDLLGLINQSAQASCRPCHLLPSPISN